MRTAPMDFAYPDSFDEAPFGMSAEAGLVAIVKIAKF